MKSWIIVDDSPEETTVLVRQLEGKGVLEVEIISASNAQDAMESGTLRPDGILVDVDLSNEAGLRFTGPGLAQSIRVAQRRRSLPSFPLVRFSAREKIRESIGSDSSSDDIFDLKVEKDGLGEENRVEGVRQLLLAVGEVYERAEERLPINEYFGASGEQWAVWGHQAAAEEMLVADLPYLRAGRLIRMLVHPGIFVDEALLAIRLGVDQGISAGWSALLERVAEIAYHGVASEHLKRWWARGLEEWWQSLGSERPLAGTTVTQRVAVLREKTSLDLVALEMPQGSIGNRPWRSCLLSWETSGRVVAVDPTQAVKIIPRSTLPSWMDPLVAALGPANRNRDDERLNSEDLDRLNQSIGRESK